MLAGVSAPWLTGVFTPSTVMFPLRVLTDALREKLKFTTPLLIVPKVSHAESLVGAKGGSKFVLVGSTGAKASLPMAKVSDLAVGSTKARGSSLTKLLV